jgi:steroid delta-isomerase-like uncharacterized protein
MPQNADTIVHDWFERVWNRQDAAAIDELMAEEAIVHGLATAEGSQMKGPSGFRGVHDAFLSAFPDLQIEVEHCIRDGDTLAFRCRVRGTHQGDGLGVAPTQRRVDFAGMGFVRVEDGKIVEAWNTFDFQRMNDQLGLGGGTPSDAIPRPAPN